MYFLNSRDKLTTLADCLEEEGFPLPAMFKLQGDFFLISFFLSTLQVTELSRGIPR